jgi:phosphatidylglycerophosphatase A
MSTLALAIATSFGVGYAPFAPGTFGSAAGLLLWAILPASAVAQVAAVIAVLAVGIWSAELTERRVGATDPGIVVVDEVLGMVVTLALVPVGWGGAIVGFVLFRAFDVIKPYPANRFERLHGGLGIMLDDAMAGVYSNLALRLVLAAAPAGLL